VGCLVIGSVWGALVNSIGLLLASRVIEGVGMGLIAVVAPASIALWFPREKQGMPTGIWATWVPMGGVVMLNLAPVLENAAGWQAVWWFGAGFALVTFILYGLLMRAPPSLAHGQESTPGVADDTPPKLKDGLTNRDIWLLALEFSCFALVFNVFRTFFPTFLSAERGYSLAQAAFITSLPTMVVLGSAPLAGWLSDRMGSRKLIYTIPFLIITVMWLFLFRLTGWQLSVFMVFLGIMIGAIPAAVFAAVPEVMGKPQLAGIGMAVLIMGQNLGMFIGPTMFGSLVEATSWIMAGYLLIPITVVGIIAGGLVKVR
jgi:MFS family permease